MWRIDNKTTDRADDARVAESQTTHGTQDQFMWIRTEYNQDGRFKNHHTQGEWVDFTDGKAQVRAEIGEALIGEYEHITEHTKDNE